MIEYNKTNRTFKKIKAIEQVDVLNEPFIELVAQRISRIVLKEKGVFPERTTIESWYYIKNVKSKY